MPEETDAAGPNSPSVHAPADSGWSATAKDYSNVTSYTLSLATAAIDALQLTPGSSMIDVACGPGDAALHAAIAHKANVTAIDFSEGMIASAKKHPNASKADGVMVGQALDFADSSFDAGLSCLGVYLFPDPMQGLRELVRVVRPSARIAIVSFAEGCSPMGAACGDFFAELAPEAAPFPELMGRTSDDGTLTAGTCKLTSIEGAQAALQAAGVTDASAWLVSQSLRAESAAGWLPAMMSNPFMQAILQRIDASKQDELSERLVAHVDQKFKNAEGVVQVPATAIVAVGTKARA